MIWKHLHAAVAAAAIVAGAGSLQSQAADPMLGTWTLNTAKSKSPYSSGTSVISAVGDAVKVTATLVAKDGTRYAWEWTAKYDGKDVPVTGTTPFGSGGTASLTRVDTHTVKTVGKMKGRAMLTQTIVVSPDGRSRTVTTTGTDPNGQPVNTVAVYDKQ